MHSLHLTRLDLVLMPLSDILNSRLARYGVNTLAHNIADSIRHCMPPGNVLVVNLCGGVDDLYCPIAVDA